jgi:hypothetical protein
MHKALGCNLLPCHHKACPFECLIHVNRIKLVDRLRVQGYRVAVAHGIVVNIDWDAVEKACIAGMDFPSAAKHFDVKEDTIRKRANRYKWPTPLAIARRAAELSKGSAKALDAAATDWNAKGEAHRAIAFEKAHESIKKFKPRAPKSFRELESAVKVARQSAGLDTADVQVATLIQLNERLENAELEQPIEATLLPDSPVKELPNNSTTPQLTAPQPVSESQGSSVAD